MTGSVLQNTDQVDSSLWEAADQRRANSKLAYSEYAMPVLGVILLRHAANRHHAARAAVSDMDVGKLKG